MVIAQNFKYKLSRLLVSARHLTALTEGRCFYAAKITVIELSAVFRGCFALCRFATQESLVFILILAFATRRGAFPLLLPHANERVNVQAAIQFIRGKYAERETESFAAYLLI